MTLALVASSTSSLVHLAPIDMVIVVFYFGLVLAIGFYLKGQANTGEDFFMAGREMTAWIAGLSFLSANLGALELMGWAAAFGRLDAPALVLYAGAISWVIGYDTIYAHQDREDDALIGIKSTALLFGPRTKPMLALFYGLAVGLIRNNMLM